MTEKDKISVKELTELLNYDYKWMQKISLEYVKNNEDTIIQNNHLIKKYLI